MISYREADIFNVSLSFRRADIFDTLKRKESKRYDGTFWWANPRMPHYMTFMTDLLDNILVEDYRSKTLSIAIEEYLESLGFIRGDLNVMSRDIVAAAVDFKFARRTMDDFTDHLKNLGYEVSLIEEMPHGFAQRSTDIEYKVNIRVSNDFI